MYDRTTALRLITHPQTNQQLPVLLYPTVNCAASELYLVSPSRPGAAHDVARITNSLSCILALSQLHFLPDRISGKVLTF